VPRFGVQWLASASHVVYVEAEDEDAAYDAAEREFRSPHLCHHCSREIDMGDWMPDDSKHGVWEV
jgi:hypothetical protein